jgi:hypothetical protein
MILDATCAPSEIRYPTDAGLLNEARQNSEKIIDLLHVPGSGTKPRTYRKKAKKAYNHFVRNRKPNKKKVRKCVKQQLGYLRRNLGTIESMLAVGGELPPRWNKRLEIIKTLYSQQKLMYDTKTHSVPDRIVSISQPHIRPIVRGKAKAPVEFGAKLDISVVDGYTRLEYMSFDAYNESGLLIEAAERYKLRTGHYPARILADKIYRIRENLSFCKKHGIRLSGPALGRPKADAVPDKKQDYADICERVEVERRISLAKRKCGLGLITAKLPETAASVIALSIVVLNLRRIQHASERFCCFLRWLLCDKQKMVFVQGGLNRIIHKIKYHTKTAFTRAEDRATAAADPSAGRVWRGGGFR